MSNTHYFSMGFPGQYYDQETGLQTNDFRYYDPTTGRYVTPDPIVLLGGINLWPYVGNNPINHTDPTGEILPAVIVIPTAVVLIATVTTGYIVPFFFDVPPLPKGAPPGSLNPGYPGPASPGPCPINEPPPISGPPPPLPPTLPPRIFIPSR